MTRGEHGNHARGADNGRAILVDTDVLGIVESLRGGLGVGQIATNHGVSPSTVSAIKHGHTWRHVTGITIDPAREAWIEAASRRGEEQDRLRALAARSTLPETERVRFTYYGHFYQLVGLDPGNPTAPHVVREELTGDRLRCLTPKVLQSCVKNRRSHAAD